MKSDKAKNHIDDRVVVRDTMPFQSIHPQVAYQAVEIAEAEMRERAIEAHFTTCISRDGSRCKQWGFWNAPCNRECDFMESFIQKLEK